MSQKLMKNYPLGTRWSLCVIRWKSSQRAQDAGQGHPNVIAGIEVALAPLLVAFEPWVSPKAFYFPIHHCNIGVKKLLAPGASVRYFLYHGTTY
jgi:hypothetical protein